MRRTLRRMLWRALWYPLAGVAFARAARWLATQAHLIP